MKELGKWLYDRPGAEIRISYYDAAGQVRPEARKRIIRGTLGSTFAVTIRDADHHCIASASGWPAEDALQKAMEKAGDKGSWE